MAELEGHIGAVWSVALSFDGDLVASGGEDGTVRLWEAAPGRSWRALGPPREHKGAVWAVALSAGADVLASGGPDGIVHLWQTHGGRPFASLRGQARAITGLALSHDGQVLASGSFDGAVKLWPTRTGTLIRTFSPERRYERLNTSGLTGITDAQRQTVLMLGAKDATL